MTDLASVGDVIDNYRSLNQHETGLANTWLAAASADLRARIPDLQSRIDADLTGQLAVQANSAVVFAVIDRLMGADRNDPTPVKESFWFRQDVMAGLRVDAGAQGSPVGSFPAVCPYPAF